MAALVPEVKTLMDATAPHPLLRRLLHRAEQPGLIPMGLVRRILSQVNALEQRLELLTRLARRYTVRGGFGANHVPIVHAHGQPTGARQQQEQAAAMPAQTAVAPERLIVKVSTPRASPAGLNPVTPLDPRTAATAPGGAPSGEARLPAPRLMPLPPVAAAASSGALLAGEPRLSPPPLVTPLPPTPLPPLAAATSSGALLAGKPRLSPPPLVTPLPPVATVTSSGAPVGEPRLSPPLVTPLPPVSASMSGEVPPGPAPAPRPPVLHAQPAGATAPHAAPSGGSPPPLLPLTRPLPPVGATLAGGVPPAAPSPRLPQVTPHPPAEGWQQGGAATPLVHPQRGSIQAGGPSPIQEVPAPKSRHRPPAAHQATTPRESGALPIPAPAPAPRPELDLDVLASKVRQRLLRQFSEERVRRGGLK